jgi:hypothetical protein
LYNIAKGRGLEALPAAVKEATAEAIECGVGRDPNYPTYMCEGKFPPNILVEYLPFADSKQCVFLKEEIEMRAFGSRKEVSYLCAKCQNRYTVPKNKAPFFDANNNFVLPYWMPGN